MISFWIFASMLLLAPYPIASEPSDDSDTVDSSFRSAGIVPLVIDVPPSSLLNATYDTKRIDLGNYIFPTRTVLPPKVSYSAESDYLFSLLIVDIDSPSAAAPVLTPYIIALTVNIAGTNVSSGEVVAPYVPITPEPGSGPHRIVILLFKQTVKLNVNNLEFLSMGVYRWRKSVRSFIKLGKMSELYAGNYFISEIPKNFHEFC